MDTLSEALISKGIISEDKLAAVKSMSKESSFIFKLLESPQVDEEQIVSIFTERFHMKRAELADILPQALENFSEKLAVKYTCIPFDRQGRQLKVAMVDPLDFNAVQAVSFATGLTVIPLVASKSEILKAINTCFKISGDLLQVLGTVAPPGEDNIEIIEDGTKDVTSVFQTGHRTKLADEITVTTPAITIVNLLLREAMASGASDVHIEPGAQMVDVRFRIDGVLKTYSQLPRWISSGVVSRIKIMAKLDISNRKTPQDGSIKLNVGNKPLDLRVSTLPTHLGEKAVIRLLTPAQGSLELKDVGFSEEELKKIGRLITQPQGIILVTGPTGSGKTTTLHAMLKDLWSEKTNIITVEDPVEYGLKGITQVKVNEKAGLTFANTLRSILRQDPDVVMVGEIRDLETAEIAFRASMTGHLVLSTLHTNNTASTITRLTDLGVESYLVSSSLLCVLSQRLVRSVCEHCVKEYAWGEDILSLLPSIDRKARFVKGAGCDKCNKSGYKGRVAVYEIMEITPTLRDMVAKKTTEKELRAQAKKEGMNTLYEAALEKVYKGITTPEEILRVIAAEEVAEKKCHNCGRLYTEDECSHCGLAPEDGCKGCGRPFETEWGFCPQCGKRRDAAKDTELPAVPRVLIVDDETGILKMVEIALKPLNLEIHTAQNGKEALEKTEQVNPNLVITDINMPVMDGFELIKELRKKVTTMFIPIVVLSSRDKAEDKLKGFTYGTDDYITKPFDYTELQARVKRLMERAYA
jgi:type IV pilus assembly protein PilB